MSQSSVSWKAIRDTVGFIGVIASLAFVGWEIRQSNRQARAAAFQQIGAQLNEYHQWVAMDSTLNRLQDEAHVPSLFAQWSVEEWRLMVRARVAAVRIAETVHLQVEQQVLPSDALERLGGFSFNTQTPALACIWPLIRQDVSPQLRSYIESNYPVRYECPSMPALDEWAAPYR